MRSNEIELITALAEGRLSDESQARALIESSPEARAAYEAQRRAIEELGGLGEASLSEIERAELRREVWTGLRSTTAPAPVRSPWWARAATGAAILVVVLGTFSIISSQLSQRQSASLEGAGEVSTLDDGASAPAGADSGADTTTTAGATAEGDRAALKFFELASDEMRDQSFTGQSLSPEDQAREEELEACVERAGLIGQRIIGRVDRLVDTVEDEDMDETESFIAVIPESEDLDADTPVTFVAEETCVVAHIED